MIPAGPRYILTRSAFVVAALVATLFAWSFFKKVERRDDLIRQLQSITTDSSFFRQFDAEDARKSLVRAVGIIAEAGLLGIPADEVIDRGLGIKREFFASAAPTDEVPVRDQLIRACLRGNYENFVKLGYRPDAVTLEETRQGSLPSIPSGPHAGKKPEIHALIRQELSPGIDRVLANLEIRPPVENAASKPGDIEIALVKRLAHDLADAGVLEEAARDRIVLALDAKP